MTILEAKLNSHKVPFRYQEKMYEIDMDGIRLINVLASNDLGYVYNFEIVNNISM